jgi:16S rRNA (guanine966-N2)-methyltransferase
MARLRITGGRLVRRQFQVPKQGVRPTSDRAREALFSVLGDLTDLVVVDLCAGSGALAFEALSRGAARALAVERNRRTAGVLKDNAQALDLDAQTEVRVDDAARVAAGAASGSWDVVFLDPPYDDTIAPALFRDLLPALAPGGRLVLERRANNDEPVPDGWKETFDRTWGEARVRILVPAPADADQG